MLDIAVNNEAGVEESNSGSGLANGIVKFVKKTFGRFSAVSSATSTRTIKTSKENKINDKSDTQNNSDDVNLELIDTFGFSDNCFEKLRLVFRTEDYKEIENVDVKNEALDAEILSQSLEEAEARFKKILSLRNKSLLSLIEEDTLSVSSFDSDECDQCKEWSVVDFENISCNDGDIDEI